MSSRPELQAPPEIIYDDVEARKYTYSSRTAEIQTKLSERALELLALPDDGVPKLLLDIGISGETLSENGHQWIGLDISHSMLNVASENEVEGDLLLSDMGQGLGLRSGVIDGAISISADQWLCNADKSSHEPRLRLKALFGSLYRSLARGTRAVLQVYLENVAQQELILSHAMRAGFAGGVIVDYPHSIERRREYLVLTCGPPSLSTQQLAQQFPAQKVKFMDLNMKKMMSRIRMGFVFQPRLLLEMLSFPIRRNQKLVNFLFISFLIIFAFGLFSSFYLWL